MAPPGAPTLGVWVEDRYCGLTTWIVAVVGSFPCSYFCPCDRRTVWVSGGIKVSHVMEETFHRDKCFQLSFKADYPRNVGCSCNRANFDCCKDTFWTTKCISKYTAVHCSLPPKRGSEQNKWDFMQLRWRASEQNKWDFMQLRWRLAHGGGWLLSVGLDRGIPLGYYTTKYHRKILGDWGTRIS